MTGPPLQQLGPAIVLQGLALADVRRCIVTAQDVSSGDGIGPPARLRQLVAAIDAALAVTERPAADTADVREEAVGAGSDHEEIGSEEAARILRRDPRTVRRLAADLGGRRSPAGGWLFHRSTVTAYAATRDERTT